MKWSVKKQAQPASAVDLGHDEIIGQAANSSSSEEVYIGEKDAHAHAKEIEDVRALKKSHLNDPNLPSEEIEALRIAAQTGDEEKLQQIEEDFTDHSPYESVRAAVQETDDPDLIANTLRAWILGFIFVTITSGINMFLSMRQPAISVPTVVVLLLVYPVGCGWAKIMPTRVFNTFGVSWTLNPGEFNIKEHTVVTLMAAITYGYAYSTDALLAMQAKPLYNINLGWGFQILFTLSSQLIGIALSGVFRRFLVWPAAMIWPANFSTTTLLYALHDKSPADPAKANGWTISRYRLFVYITLGAFAWYWVPGVIFQALSVIAFPTWIAPNNVVVNQLFGGYSGLSLLPLTLDWTYVSAYLQSPLLSPVFSHANTLVGLGIFVIFGAIGIVYTGAIYSDYLPINTNQTYDNKQHSPYKVRNILGPGFTFDQQKYAEYSPLFLAPTFILNYGLNFAATTAAIVHTVLNDRKEIWARFKHAGNNEPDDIHMRLMSVYRACPDWWYLVLGVVSVGLGLATVLGFPLSQMPWWAYFVSLLLALIWIIPNCMILAMTNIQLSLNVISPFIAGFIIPGRPVAVMIFKVYSTIVLGQAQTFGQNLKLAHYMKIPPRITFAAQVSMAMWSSVVQIATMNWVLGNIEGVCGPTQPAHFTCPNGRSFFASSIVWGVIGPRRMFGAGSIYVKFNYFWLLGAGLPIAFYVIKRVLPYKGLRFLHAPVMLGALGWLPPATPLSFSSWAIVGFIFNYWIHNKWNGWWRTYNYITSAALDSGLIIATLVIFFAITLPNVTLPQWWGNVGALNTTDANYKAFSKTLAPGETFGPSHWEL